MNTDLSTVPSPHIAAVPAARQSTAEEKLEELESQESIVSSTHQSLISLEKDLRTRGFSVESMQAPDGNLRDGLELPCKLNPFHVACIAMDSSLLQSALNDARYNAGIDKHTEESETITRTVIEPELAEVGLSQPLHYALLNGWDEGALKLIDALEAEDKLEHTVNQTGSSVLSMAVSYCGIDVVERLCQHFRQSEHYESYLHHKTADGKNLLHHAAQRSDAEVFEYIRRQMLSTFEEQYANGHKEARSPAGAEAERDTDGKTPIDMIRDRVGQLYAYQLDHDEDLRQQKVLHNAWNSDWEHYYIKQCHGERISWVPPWQMCSIL